MNKDLIPINNLWYRLKCFFRKLFLKGKKEELKDVKSVKGIETKNNVIFSNNLKENKKQVLAKKLLYGELNTNELDDNEVDEMIDFFARDIENIDNELLIIKKHILSMKKQLKQE